MNESERKNMMGLKQEDPLKVFRNRMKRLIGESLDAEQLDQEDLDLYSLYQAGQVNIEELQHRESALPEAGHKSKKDFLTYLINSARDNLDRR